MGIKIHKKLLHVLHDLFICIHTVCSSTHPKFQGQRKMQPRNCTYHKFAQWAQVNLDYFHVYVLISRTSTEYKYMLVWIKAYFVGFFK